MTSTFFVQASPEARQRALRRMLTQNPKVKVRLTEGQKRALEFRRACRRDPQVARFLWGRLPSGAGQWPLRTVRGDSRYEGSASSVPVRDEYVVTREEIEELRARIARLECREDRRGARE